jgi:hypothetical protein
LRSAKTIDMNKIKIPISISHYIKSKIGRCFSIYYCS